MATFLGRRSTVQERLDSLDEHIVPIQVADASTLADYLGPTLPVVIGLANLNEPANPALILCMSADDVHLVTAKAQRQELLTIPFRTRVDWHDLLAPPPDADILDRALSGIQLFMRRHHSGAELLTPGDYARIGRTWGFGKAVRIPIHRSITTSLVAHQPNEEGHVITVYKAAGHAGADEAESIALTAELHTDLINASGSPLWPPFVI